MRIKQILLLLLFSIVAVTSAAQASPVQEVPAAAEEKQEEQYKPKSVTELVASFWKTTGLSAIVNVDDGEMTAEPHGEGRLMSAFESSVGRLIMLTIVFILFYLAIAKNFEPLLLIPIAFGGLLANIPLANMGGCLLYTSPSPRD